MPILILAVLVLCFISGATSLVYETLWIRVLSLGVGSTSGSMSIVLAIFFLGLSLGSYCSGRFCKNLRRPLLAYGVVEGLLGLTSLLILSPLFQIQNLLAYLPLSGSFSWMGVVAKFLLVFFFLIIPTCCMGATFPILTRFFEQRKENMDKGIGLIYAINTAGAVFGAVICGFYLIPHFGILKANQVAVCFNFLIIIAAYLLDRFLVSKDAKTTEENTVEDEKPLGYRERIILLACGISGFVSIACEVVWSKYLSIFLGTNIYGVGIVLAMFLVGIALGSFLMSRFIERVKEKEKLFTAGFLASAFFILLTTLLLNETPKWSVYTHIQFLGVFNYLFIKTMVTAFILFLPTCIFGALFPLGIHLISNAKNNAPKIVGLAYSVNTIGAILGSCVAGLILIPSFGSSDTIKAVVVVSLVMVFFLWNLNSAKEKTVPVLTLLLIGTVFFIHPFDFKNLLKSAYHQQGIEKNISRSDALKKAFLTFSDSYEEFQKVIEGVTGIISLSHDPKDGSEYRKYYRLKNNGLNESIYNRSNLNELPKYEALIGLLPYVFSKEPKNAFVVGYGGGFTVDFLTDTDLKKVNVVELEEGILKAADFVHKGQNPILKKESLSLQIEDARYVLATRQLGLQDIIISQPSHSWLAGAANLFTKEFFIIVRDNLSSQGVFSQWLNLYNMDVNVLKSILHTFYSVFPHGAVFTQKGDQEMVLLGSMSPINLNAEKLERITVDPKFKNKLSAVITNSSFDLLSLFSLSRADVVELTKDAEMNTDINAYAEINQSKLFYDGVPYSKDPQVYLSSVYRGDFSQVVSQLDPSFYYKLLASMNGNGQKDKLMVLLHRYESLLKKDKKQLSKLGQFYLNADRLKTAEKYLLEAIQREKTSSNLTSLTSLYVEKNQPNKILTTLETFAALREPLSDCHEAYARVRLNKGAKAVVDKLVVKIPFYSEKCGPFLNKVLGMYYLSSKNYETAIPFLEAYYALYSSDRETVQYMVAAYQGRKDPSNEKQFISYLIQLKEYESQATERMVKYFESNGLNDDAKALNDKARQSLPL